MSGTHKVTAAEGIETMSVGRVIDPEGHVTLIERPTWESVLDAMLVSDTERQHRLERDLMLLNGAHV